MSTQSHITPGTVAFEVLQLLRTRNHEMTTTALSLALGRPAKDLPKQLAKAVDSRHISRRQGNGGIFWGIGEATHQAAAQPQSDTERTVTRVSALAAPSVFAYADSRKAAPFSTALSTDGRLTVERYGRVLLELTDEERKLFVKTATKGVKP